MDIPNQMTHDEILQAFERIKCWKRKSTRAPHKPLLILYALAQWQKGNRKLLFGDIASDLDALLTDFGPPRVGGPQYPFWNLEKDNIWNVIDRDKVEVGKGDKAKVASLKKHYGQFSEPVRIAIERDSSLIGTIANQILSTNFPETIHEDICVAVGLSLKDTDPKQSKLTRSRDPRFREQVLLAYEQRCAICQFDLRLMNTPMALEAAHIKWHQAGGPDEVPNGLALCSIHHKLFDLGAFTIRPKGQEYQILVSEKAMGTSGRQVLHDFHSKTIQKPQSTSYEPDKVFLQWHEDEVFKSRSREL